MKQSQPDKLTRVSCGWQATDASGAGGGLFLYQLTAAVASDNQYTRNSATSFGGGIYILGLTNTRATVANSRWACRQCCSAADSREHPGGWFCPGAPSTLSTLASRPGGCGLTFESAA